MSHKVKPEDTRMITCRGEAHRNFLIDHCMTCIPYWETYPACERHGRKLRMVKSGYMCDGADEETDAVR